MTDQKFFNWVESCKARATVYQHFSVLFCEPEADILGNRQIFDTLKTSLSNLKSIICHEIPSLMGKAHSYPTEELLIEYSRLFIGPFKTLAPPYSSVYLSSKGTVFGDETMKVIDFYHRSGLEANRDAGEIPDHLVIELEFIYYLIFHQIKELEEQNFIKAFELNNIETEFKTDHLNRWVPLFCEKVIIKTENEFYKKLAGNLKQFIIEDKPSIIPQ